MSELMDKAFAALKTLPQEDQDRISWEIIERVKDKSEWDRIVSAPESRAWLAAAASKALKAYGKMRKPLSIAFVSIPGENLLRGKTYWSSFEDLPDEIKKEAEASYRLWQKNANHPGLRFKQIHPDMPIFSFRVGMRHRSVGVRADDGRMVWFWVGSFETFREQSKIAA